DGDWTGSVASFFKKVVACRATGKANSAQFQTSRVPVSDASLSFRAEIAAKGKDIEYLTFSIRLVGIRVHNFLCWLCKKLPQVQWQWALDEVQMQLIDFCISVIMETDTRRQMATFSSPIMAGNMKLMVRKQVYDNRWDPSLGFKSVWFSWLQPFSPFLRPRRES
ncbi:unnamed protein product, partial [Symbiodinium sp. KB8]